MLIFFILRIFFVIYNIHQLPSTNFAGLASLIWGSLLYDWIFSWYSLIPVFFITWLQIHFPNQKILAVLGRTWFALVILIVSTLTFIDAFYFPFAKVRTGAELLTLTGDNNTSMMVYISDYWWAILAIFGYYIHWVLFLSENETSLSKQIQLCVITVYSFWPIAFKRWF